jgi:predicted kinase
MLYIFGGLPGTGKSTLSRYLAQDLPAVHLRIDLIEHALREAGVAINGPEGYVVAYRLAADNLRLGQSVVADSVNPIEITRAAWRQVAAGVGSPLVEIEVICSDVVEHRRRVETRVIDIPDFVKPTWDEVINREYEVWDTDHIVIDTAHQTLQQSMGALRLALEDRQAW